MLIDRPPPVAEEAGARRDQQTHENEPVPRSQKDKHRLQEKPKITKLLCKFVFVEPERIPCHETGLGICRP